MCVCVSTAAAAAVTYSLSSWGPGAASLGCIDFQRGGSVGPMVALTTHLYTRGVNFFNI